MGKKCIPGFFCIENMSLFIICFLLLIILYLTFRFGNTQSSPLSPLSPSPDKVLVISPPVTHTQHHLSIGGNGWGQQDPFSDPYAPPLQLNDIYIPPPLPTRGYGTEFQQVGILTKTNDISFNENKILPLMGRKLGSGRDKFQYYTISNTGSLNTKLPIQFRNKDGMSEYGCDEIFNGDEIFVKGYNTSFTATIYENGTFRYIR